MREGDLRKAKTRGKDFFCLAPTVSLYSSFRSLRFPFSKKKKTLKGLPGSKGEKRTLPRLYKNQTAPSKPKKLHLSATLVLFSFRCYVVFLFLVSPFPLSIFRERRKEREGEKERVRDAKATSFLLSLSTAALFSSKSRTPTLEL